MEGELERAKLAEDYPYWRVWRNAALVYGWRPKTSPPVTLRDQSVAGLRARMETFERVLATEPLGAARDAAEALET